MAKGPMPSNLESSALAIPFAVSAESSSTKAVADIRAINQHHRPTTLAASHSSASTLLRSFCSFPLLRHYHAAMPLGTSAHRGRQNLSWAPSFVAEPVAADPHTRAAAAG